jgi:hypothetical protein
MVAPRTASVRVLIDVSPPLLAEAISRLIRRPDIVTYIDLAADRGHSEPVEIAITDGVRLATAPADLVIRVPAEPTAVRKSIVNMDSSAPNVVDLSDLYELVSLVGGFVNGRKPN